MFPCSLTQKDDAPPAAWDPAASKESNPAYLDKSRAELVEEY